MDFSEQVKNVRKQLGLSQMELAEALSVSFSTVNRWENSKNKPSKMAQRMFSTFCTRKGIRFDDEADK